MTELLDWAEDQDATNKLSVRWLGVDNRAMCASEAFQKGQLLMRIPFDVIVTDEVVQDEEQAKFEEGLQDLKLGSLHQRAVWLLKASKDEQHFFHSWTKILPKSFGSYPCFFSDEELEMLRGSSLHQLIVKYKQLIAQNYELVSSAVETCAFTLEEYQKAIFLILSRAFSFQATGARGYANVPVLDMLNHSFTPNAQYAYDSEYEGYELRALRDIAVDEEITISYGDYQDAQSCFIHYGFLGSNMLPFAVSLQPADPGYQAKAKMLAAKGQLSRTFKLGPGTEKVPGLIDWLKFLCYDESTSKDELEAIIWKRLGAMFQEKLAGLPEEAKEAPIGPNAANCQAFFKLERSVFTNMVAKSKTMLQYVETKAVEDLTIWEQFYST